MTRPKPIRRVHIPLSGRMYVTAVIWRNEQDMYDGTPVTGRDFDSCFIQEEAGNCIGRIHLHRDRLTTELIAHETKHAIDWYHERLHDELLARLTGRCIAMISEAAEDLPLAP